MHNNKKINLLCNKIIKFIEKCINKYEFYILNEKTYQTTLKIALKNLNLSQKQLKMVSMITKCKIEDYIFQNYSTTIQQNYVLVYKNLTKRVLKIKKIYYIKDY
ncbi:hypothetical protein OSSY52_16620 [Tepiditoga spiralis]|uniref:Uncharacterized protein n=1 Tax=Tepiditoga spiralis TaxID=2108365 RepID=A0A7G1G547_9BACT|nr:hypothetical protein [Tepiditoga spiralis]BBE31521.1 hypothetical protein OSSY52_16620 [Tepiditoga spiralis]